QQTNQLMSRQIIAPSIHAAHAIRIAISNEADVVRMLFQKGRATRIVFLDRLRIDSAEKGVMLSIQGGNSASRAGEQLFEASCADTEEGVVREAKFRFSDELEIHEAL